MQTFTYSPQGVCSRLFEISVGDDKVISFNAIGGCSGNLQGIGRLIAGMPVDEVISRMEGVRCGFKDTSCPDQLARALRALKAEQKEADEEAAPAEG